MARRDRRTQRTDDDNQLSLDFTLTCPLGDVSEETHPSDSSLQSRLPVAREADSWLTCLVRGFDPHAFTGRKVGNGTSSSAPTAIVVEPADVDFANLLQVHGDQLPGDEPRHRAILCRQAAPVAAGSKRRRGEALWSGSKSLQQVQRTRSMQDFRVERYAFDAIRTKCRDAWIVRVKVT